MTASEYILSAINTKLKEGLRLTNNEVKKVIEAISKIAKDKNTFKVFKGIFNKIASDNNNALKYLTKREIEIIELIGQQEDSIAISEKLKIKLSTVETHRKNIRRKLKITGRGRLYDYAVISNLIKIVTYDDDKIKNLR